MGEPLRGGAGPTREQLQGGSDARGRTCKGAQLQRGATARGRNCKGEQPQGGEATRGSNSSKGNYRAATSLLCTHCPPPFSFFSARCPPSLTLLLSPFSFFYTRCPPFPPHFSALTPTSLLLFLHSLPPFPSPFYALAAPFPPRFSALTAPLPSSFSGLAASPPGVRIN